MQDQLNKKFSSFADSKNYKGYLQSEEPKIDNVLAHIGPGSPCGEFFRRYWHPVSLSSEVGESPIPLKILGEDLVLFRAKNGELGGYKNPNEWITVNNQKELKEAEEMITKLKNKIEWLKTL